MRVVGFAILFLFLGGSCAHTETEDVSIDVPPQSSQVYFPVTVGSSWTYKISPAPAESNIETVSIVETLPGNRFKDSRGDIFQLRTSGVHDGSRYLMKMPLAVGHHWMAVRSATVVERYKILAKDLTIAVPAGIFKHCMKIQGEVDIRPGPNQPSTKMKMEWIYAPYVGIIQLTQYVQPQGASEPKRTAQYQLLKYNITKPAVSVTQP